jgi:large subunit ribosomal protein L3
MIDDSTSPSKGMEVAVPVTILETPKITVVAIRAYSDTYAGRQCLGDVVASGIKALGYMGYGKDKISKGGRDTNWLDGLKEVSDISVIAITHPEMAGTPRKKPDVVEIAIGGKTIEEKVKFAKDILGKELSVKDVFTDGEWADTVAVTRGHGWQGAVKRHGVAKQRRKATGRVRHVGTLGPWHPAYVMYTTPQAGQMGHHRRTQLNTRILAIESDPAKINPAGGFPHYGVVKTEYVVVRGSVQGTQKRFVFLRKGVRAPTPPRKPQLLWIGG